MSKLEIQEQYKEKIAQAETAFERQMLEAEMKHQLRMMENGVDAEAQRKASQYECIGCGS
jgi:hypothetical protein